MDAPKRIACAIYTRKSPGEGLDLEYNTLHAQRETAEKYIASQTSKGLFALPDEYNDGGFTGGNTDRPGLQRLVADIEAGKVNCVVVYKIDRLSRSLVDFVKLVEFFEKHDVTFISVTQDFNTTSSMGRLTFNILLSFAQFEREQIGERIRDKIALQKAKGKHCGGTPPLGYDIVDHKLAVNPAEAETVRHIFRRFAECGSTTQLVTELKTDGIRTKAWKTVKGRIRQGRPFNKSHLYRMMSNRKYLGEITHKGKIYPGEHEAIIDRKQWDAVHAILKSNHQERSGKARNKTNALLKGVAKCGHCGTGMQSSYTKKKGRTYRYYLCENAAKHGHDSCPLKTAPSGEVEAAVVERLRALLADSEMTARAIRVIESEPDGVDTEKAVAALKDLEGVWEHLFPAERARIVELLVQRVDIHTEGLRIAFRDNGIRLLAAEAADMDLGGVPGGETRPAFLADRDGPAFAAPRVAVRGGSGFLEAGEFEPEAPVVAVPLTFGRRCGRKRILSATGQGRSAGMEGGESFLKRDLSSSGCESRPAKA